MLLIQNDERRSILAHQKIEKALFYKKSESLRELMYDKELLREIPKNAISIFDESYIKKKGILITTGAFIHVAKKDADFIKEGPSERFDQEVARIGKILGIPQYSDIIRKIIRWAAENHYENEKTLNGDLDINFDILGFLTKNEIKIGDNYYKIPEEVLKAK